MREYGAFWLRELGEEEELRRRHHRHYREAAVRAEAEWAGRVQLDWTDWAHREYPNLRAAIEHTVTGPDGLELVAALWFLWFCAGRITEGRRYLERALAYNRRPAPARTKALWASAWVALAQGDLSRRGGPRRWRRWRRPPTRGTRPGRPPRCTSPPCSRCSATTSTAR